VGGRHIVGHFLATAVFGALAQAIPDRVLADGAANIWITQFTGKDAKSRSPMCFLLWGWEHDRKKIALATAFPSGIQGIFGRDYRECSPWL
jgi:N-methylhydantoinase B